MTWNYAQPGVPSVERGFMLGQVEGLGDPGQGMGWYSTPEFWVLDGSPGEGRTAGRGKDPGVETQPCGVAPPQPTPFPQSTASPFPPLITAAFQHFFALYGKALGSRPG